MSDVPPPVPPPADPPPDIRIQAGRDVDIGSFVGGNQVNNTQVNNTQVGYSASAVQRLLITVGVLVFVTAACFFSGGLAIGFGAFVALNRPVNSNNASAAARFEQTLAQVKSLPAGQPFELGFTEEEISSYFRLTLAPQLGITDGKIRLLGSTQPGTLVVGGQATQMNNLRFAATFDLQSVPGAPLQLRGAAVQVLPLGNVPFGWVAVPPGALDSLTQNINQVFQNITLTAVTDQSTTPAQPAWIIEGLSR